MDHLSQFNLLEHHFHILLEINDKDEQSIYLNREEIDPELRVQLTSLIELHDQECLIDEHLEVDTQALAQQLIPGLSPQTGQAIGAYCLIREIGSGGMGSVWLARRSDGAFDRHVAIKMMLPGIWPEELNERFLVERNVLARLQNPFIAQLLDGGTTKDHQPYIVMEYIQGKPITEYCRDLGLPEIMSLFIDVCRAVHYAHQSLIIHRDLKPHNILVTPKGKPKLLDFGIAKLLDEQQSGQEETRFSVAYTRKYASPEQIAGDTISTPSDIYSLGLVLFEVIVGEGFVVMTKKGPRSIVEIPAKNLNQQVIPADLRQILAKCLKVEPARRYQSAHQLMEDLQHFKCGKPVSAQPDRISYRFRLFVNRHKYISILSTLFMTLLLSSSLIMTNLYRRAQAENAKAKTNLAFLQDVLTSIEPEQALGRDTTFLVDVLTKAESSFEAKLSQDRDARASISYTLGQTYLALGELDKARDHLEASLAFYLKSQGPNAQITIELKALMGTVLIEIGDYTKSSAFLIEAVESAEEYLGTEHPITLTAKCDLGLVYNYLEMLDEAFPILKEVAETRRRILPPDDSTRYVALHNYADYYTIKGQLSEAEVLYREAYELSAEHLSDRHPLFITSLNNLAYILRKQGKVDTAEYYTIQAYETAKETYGATHPKTLIYLSNTGALYFAKKDMVRAYEIFNKAYHIRVEVLGEKHPSTLTSAYNLSKTLIELNRFTEAVPFSMKAYTGRTETHGPTHKRTMSAMLSYAYTLRRNNQLKRACEVSKNAVEIVRNHFDSQSSACIEAYSALTDVLCAMDSKDEAQANYAQLLIALKSASKEDQAYYHERHQGCVE